MSSAVAVRHGKFGRAAIYRMDKPMAVHAHREGHLIFKLGGPDGTCTVEGLPFSVNQATAAAVNPWQPHCFAPDDGLQDTCCLILYVDPARFLEAGRSATGILRFGSPSVDITTSIARLIGTVADRLLDGAEDLGLAEDIFTLTERCFEQSWRSSPAKAVAEDGGCRGSDFRIRNSLNLMRSRLGDELLLDHIARDAGLSRPHFFKLFRKQVGLTPNLYLNLLKTERSVQLLTTTREPVTTIGFDLGFASQASFTRFFTANVGIPPTDYRRASLARG
ncbi:MAG: AraC family transcriptional regulator [Hyphomicrobiaceae bacterium]